MNFPLCLRACVPLGARAALLILAFATPTAARAAEGFRVTPDHEVQPGVPRGTVTKMPPWTSQIFPGTTRDWWIYTPAQYQPDGTAALMVFQDGAGYLGPTGNWRAPVVFDNLIARGELPITVAVFINPGHDATRGELKKGGGGASNRGLEYNSLGDRYARFLLGEILPEVARRFPYSADPERHAIAGSSSGAIAAFTVAWERPDAFRKVLSTVGSFVNLAGGDAYPSLVRKTERKPIRVFQQDSSGDLDNRFGHWPTANRQLHAALRYMGYDARLDYAEGYGHNSQHGGSIFPEALRWLWRAEQPAPAAASPGDLAGDMTLRRLLIDGEGWEEAVAGLGIADGACADDAGNFYYTDIKNPGIFKLTAEGATTRISAETASGLKFGPDGRLYGCLGPKQRLFTVDLATGAGEILLENVQPNDLVVTRRGHIYFTETAKKQVTFFDPATKTKLVVDTGLANPNGLTLSPDQGTLAVSEHAGGTVWTFRINIDGTLDAKTPYMTMRRLIDTKGDFQPHMPPPYLPAARGDGMTCDTLGRFYVTTALGVQVFDPTGRLCGVLTMPPTAKGATSCVLAGAARNILYVTHGDKIYRRKVQAQGIATGR